MIKWIVLLFLSPPCFAFTVQSEIAGVDLARDASKPNLVFLHQDGLVGKLPPQETKMLHLLTEGVTKHQIFEITMNQDRFITSAKLLGEVPLPRTEEFAAPSLGYIPTVLPDMDTATQIFDELNPHWRRRAECFNKAHVWVYEESKKRNINLMKVFLFFTTKYIRDYNYKWWFHVTPFVMVNEGRAITENVIDYTFMKGPTKMHQWTDYFITPKTACPTVKKYSDYEQHQEESDCYLIKKSMYFWQPQDIDALERTGAEKTEFLKEEVDTAYGQAF